MPETRFQGFTRDNGLHIYVEYIDRGPMEPLSIVRAFDDCTGDVELTPVEKCRFHFEIEETRPVVATAT